MVAPLEGVRVVDMTSALAGPFCTLLLAGLGADVIKIEAPGGSDLARSNAPYIGPSGVHMQPLDPQDLSVFFLNRSRNKRSVTLDAKSPTGRALLYRLIERSDVFVQNLSLSTVERLGADYESLRKINGKLIYCSILGVDKESPFAGMKVVDILIQALSGIMDVTGEPGTPPMRVGIPIGDFCAPLFALSGILAALHMRERTGRGQELSVSLVDALASLVAAEQFDALEAVGIPSRTGNSHARLAPFGVYPCEDGYVAVAAMHDNWFVSLVDAMGRSYLAADPRFSTRAARALHGSELDEIVTNWTRERSQEQVLSLLTAKGGVPSVAVRSIGDVISDYALQENGALVPLHHPNSDVNSRLMGSGLPWHFSDSSVDLNRPAPWLGADNSAVYGALLGLSDEELQTLSNRGVI